MTLRTLTACAALVLATATASADQVIFKNGDKITGKIVTMEGGKMTIATAVAGPIVVDMKDVETFSTDTPIEIRTADGRKVNEPVTTAETDQVKTSGGEVLSLAGVTKINPPAEVWHGSVLVSGAIARGNTNTDDLGIAIAAGLRRNNETVNDRFTLGGAYNLGLQENPDTGDKVTTTDNWNAFGQYDYFWDPKFYTYANFKVEHDRIADLNYRLSPSAGVGYQWFERPDFNFRTEAGVAYVYEDFISDGENQTCAVRLAYHIDRKFNDVWSVFHNFEIFPAIDDPHDYNLATDAGVRAALTAAFFTEFRVEWKRDSDPAPGADKNDLRYVLGVGWKF
jgi:putative salt-induced outer membrane protein YdiY